MLVELAVADLGVLADLSLVLGPGRTLVFDEVDAGVDGGDRVVERSRMLSGHPDSPAAKGHAEELLAVARRGSG